MAQKVVFVLGGPGAGKGTQCDNIVSEFGLKHFSAGDLLRAEVKSGSETGRMIDEHIKQGTIVPGHVTIGLLKSAIEGAKDAPGFLIDGFPREMQQAIDFEAQICECQFVLVFECSEKCMEERLLKRGETSGRTDDNSESIKKRFRTFVEVSYPVVKSFETKGKVVKINAERGKDDVYADVKKAFLEHGFSLA